MRGNPITWSDFVILLAKPICRVVHLQIQTTKGCFMRFVAAKSRVSLLQDYTIPRLELLDALLLSRQLARIASVINCKLTLNSPVHFTDLKVVLFWIQGCDKE